MMPALRLQVFGGMVNGEAAVVLQIIWEDGPRIVLHTPDEARELARQLALAAAGA